MSEFECPDCGNTFHDLTELFGHDPEAEAAERYPLVELEDMIAVCDDCYALRIAESTGAQP